MLPNKKPIKTQDFVPLSPEEMALPFGKKPSQEQLDEFLDRKQGRGTDVETVRNRILNKPAAGKK